jgi:2-polyprenyl-3-methyl-5-hydroxy-6-metoxy-1,4-benzoquinol methylase
MGKDLIKENCPVCGSPLNEEYAQSMYCSECKTLYTPYWDNNLYDEAYKDKYIAHWESETNGPIQECRWNLVKHFKSSGNLIDIGCGTGSFLRAAPKNFTVCGCDVNPHCVDYCNKNGIKATHTSCPIERKEYDFVTMFDVIEHNPDLEIVSKVKSMLKDDGFFIFCTPNFKPSLLENIEGWRHYRPAGEHVFCFSEKSVMTIAKRFDMEVIDINFEESKIRLPERNIATYVLQKKKDNRHRTHYPFVNQIC